MGVELTPGSAAAGYVIASNKPDKAVLEACWELGAMVAAGLMEG